MEDHIKTLESALNWNKKKYSDLRKYMYKLVKWYKYPLVILAALSTIVLGLEFGNDLYIQWQKNIALVITATITLLTTLMTFWNIEEYWLQNKVIEQQLDMLKQKFLYEKSKGMDEEMADKLHAELMDIIGQQHSYWKSALDESLEGSDDGTS